MLMMKTNLLMLLIKHAMESLSKSEAVLCINNINNPKINWETLSTDKYNLAELIKRKSGPFTS